MSRRRMPTLLSVVKQVEKAGLEVARVEVEPGKFVIITSRGDSVIVEPTNPWDEILNGGGEHAPKQKRTA